jgi:DNA-binding transcriptional LysR family regulator
MDIEGSRAMSDFRNVETFVWVARLGGFRLAADKLNTTQPAISARVAMLERELGVSLFERKRRGALTPKGLELLGYAEKMLHLRTEMVRQVGAANALRGVLRLGALETIAHTWLTALLKRVRAGYPGISLQIDIDTTPKLRKSLVSQELDISCQLGALDEPHITNLPLCSYRVVWIASPNLHLPDRRLSLADLACWPIMSSRLHVPHAVTIKQSLERLYTETAQHYTSTSIASIVHMTRDGIGVGVIPWILVQRELAEGSLVLLDTDVALPDLELFVSYSGRPDNHLAPIIAELAIEVAREYGSGEAAR